MRQRIASPILRYLVLAIALVLAAGTPALADDRADARTHYQAGVKFYNGGDYRNAIREFSAAHQLVPADLNNYNLALCYDKLGDPEPAIQYYRAYLDKVPATDKRAEIEASVARLDAAAKSVAAKKAEEARKVDEARKAEEMRKADEARKAEEARLAAEARKAEEARLAAEAAKRNQPIETDTNSRPLPSGGSTGTPATGVVSTGDASLDRVSNIDVNGIRDQRQVYDPYAAQQGQQQQAQQGQQMTAGAANAGVGAPPQQGAQQGQQGAQGQQGQVTALDQPIAKPVPVYKKWWFWAVVAVSAYVVYQIANDDSSPSTTRARETLPLGPAPQPNSGGMTLMRW